MSEFYIPFDFGSWKKALTCPVHGIQHGGLVISVTSRPGATTITRRYCGLCVIQMLDAALPRLEET